MKRRGRKAGDGTGIRLIVFDMDGTLTRPYLDFSEIRRAVGATDTSLLVLDYILGLPPKEKREALEILERFEEKAAEKAQAQEGAVELLAELRRREIKTAIFTRNSRKSVETVVTKLGLDVDRFITREDAPPKPQPDAILQMLDQYRIGKDDALMVGDFYADVETGRRAGIGTVLLVNDNAKKCEMEPDYRIKKLTQILDIIDGWHQRNNS